MNNLSLVLPVYNEAKIIEQLILDWENEFKKLKIDYEIIICEDGSTDGTKEILNKIFKDNSRVINNCVDYRRGYGKAVISGIKTSKNDYVLCVDSDGQCDPNDLNNFIKNIKDHDFIIGARKYRQDSKLRLIYSFLFKVFHDLLFRSGLMDPSCPFVIIKKSFFLKIEYLLINVKEAFWWAFVAASIRYKAKYFELVVNHRTRGFGETQVYKMSKMPAIIIRNMLSIIKIRFAKKK